MGLGQAWGLDVSGCSLRQVPGWLRAGARTGHLWNKNKQVRANPGLEDGLTWPPAPRLGSVGPKLMGASAPSHYLWCLPSPRHPCLHDAACGVAQSPCGWQPHMMLSPDLSNSLNI